jgi:hypothetical protein
LGAGGRWFESNHPDHSYFKFLDYLNITIIILRYLQKGFLVPTISEFFGIKILMYWDEHNPPHFHAEYGDFKAIVSIKEAVVIRGAFPVKQLKLVLAWCEIHHDELINNWESAKVNGKISKIDPLK